MTSSSFGVYLQWSIFSGNSIYGFIWIIFSTLRRIYLTKRGNVWVVKRCKTDSINTGSVKSKQTSDTMLLTNRRLCIAKLAVLMSRTHLHVAFAQKHSSVCLAPTEFLTSLREGFCFWFPSTHPFVLRGRKLRFFWTGDFWKILAVCRSGAAYPCGFWVPARPFQRSWVDGNKKRLPLLLTSTNFDQDQFLWPTRDSVDLTADCCASMKEAVQC